MGMAITDIRHFDYSLVDKLRNVARTRGNNGTKSRKVYKSIWCAFDIETTQIEGDQSIMYVWAFQFGDYCTVTGRTWEEYLTFLRKLKAKLAGSWLVIYVHNFSYEYSFLKGIYEFTPEEVFAIGGRKVIKADMMGAFEYRCSYYQNNTNLDEFAKEWAHTRKESGKRFNYKKARYPWTRLTRKERQYIYADVRALEEAIRNKAEYFGDTQYTIVLTSTGYVRRDTKKVMHGGFNHKQLVGLLPDLSVMLHLQLCFRGGNTHCNRFYANMILPGVGTDDISSAYPAEAIIEDYFAMGPWYTYKDPRNMTIEQIIELMGSGKEVLMELTFHKIGLRGLNKSLWGNPYIPRHKCQNIIGGIYDNGRVLYADELTTNILSKDLRIILSEYDFDDVEVSFIACSNQGRLPNCLTDYILMLYKKKTELKGINGRELEYNLAKQRVNSVYGMMVTSLLKPDMEYDPDTRQFIKKALDYEERIAKETKKAFLSYAWGCQITSGCREKIERAMRIAGNNFVYCDTDSIKYIEDVDLSGYNEELRLKAEAVGAYACDKNGDIHYLGVFEHEGRYKEAKFLGAKRYAYEYMDGSFGITISGVNKKLGGKELKAMGGLKAFEDGVVFSKAGGTEVVYNDNTNFVTTIEGRDIRVTDNACIKESIYTLGITGEYLRIINHPDMWYRILERDEVAASELIQKLKHK